MNYKKYLLFIILVMILGLNTIYADTCYYQVAGENSLAYDSNTGKFRINDSAGANVKWYQFAKKGEKIKNFDKDFDDKEGLFTVGTGLTVSAIPKGTCPAAIVYRHFSNSEAIFGFNNSGDASNFANASKQLSRSRLFTGEEKMEVSTIFRSYITEEEYESNLIEETGAPVEKKDNSFELTESGTDVNVDCNEIFGSKSDPDSIAYLVNKILEYPRYIVPALVILLGTLDLFKAVIAGKEDEMKKAQRTLIKRVIIGVLVFLVPVLINVIMWLADIVWSGGYTHCNL